MLILYEGMLLIFCLQSRDNENLEIHFFMSLLVNMWNRGWAIYLNGFERIIFKKIINIVQFLFTLKNIIFYV